MTRIFTKEHRQKLSLAHMGKKLTEEHKENIKIRMLKYNIERHSNSMNAEVCAECGMPVTPYRKKARYFCSGKCNNKHRSKNPKRKEYMKEYVRKYYNTSNGHESYRKSRHRYERSDKGKVFRKNNKALRRGSYGRYTMEQLNELLKKHGHKCAQCGSNNKIEIDHVIPISKGGSNTIDNLQPLCAKCNRKKGARIK